MNLLDTIFLGFVGGWLGGLVWALIVAFRANRKGQK